MHLWPASGRSRDPCRPESREKRLPRCRALAHSSGGAGGHECDRGADYRSPLSSLSHLAWHLLRGYKKRGATVVYLWVSRQAQKPDLANQRTVLEQFCAARGIAVTEWVSEIGGGLN